MNYNIIYHRDADGLMSGFHINRGLKDNGVQGIINTIDIQYGEEVSIDELKDTIVYIVDFSFKPEILNEIAEVAVEVIVIDHHASAKKELIDDNPKLKDNIEINIDTNKAGCMLCMEYRKCVLGSPIYTNETIVTQYIQDRDLWKFELDESQAINEYINLNLDLKDIDSVDSLLKLFTVQNAILTGKSLLKYKDKLVDSKIADDKLQHFNILGIECIGFNSTNFISEIGNKLCIKYNKVSVQYFVLQNTDVVLSFRSLNELADVSILAKKLGGGGHPNAAGATITLEQFVKLMKEGIL